MAQLCLWPEPEEAEQPGRPAGEPRQMIAKPPLGERPITGHPSPGEEPGTSVPARPGDVRPGDHVAHLYESAAQQAAVAAEQPADRELERIASIHQSARAEQAVRESEHRLRTVFSAVS